MLRLLRSLLWRVMVLAIFVLLSGLVISVYIIQIETAAVKNYLYTDLAKLPTNNVAMVLGAGVYSRSEPSPILAERLVTSAELIRLGKASMLLMSGDGRVEDYDEVITMQNYAIKLGVPKDKIQIDDRGLRTYDSCYRAKKVSGLRSLTIVTQRTHLIRALYTCRQLGLDAVGAEVPASGSGRSITNYMYDQAALVLAWFDLNLFHPQP